MSDLHELLGDPTPDVDVPDLGDLWAKGRKQRRNRNLGRGAVAAAMVGLLGVGGMQIAGNNDNNTRTADVASSENDDAELVPEDRPIDTVGPGLNDHWHNAFGLFVCGEFLPDPQGDFDPVGIHSHQDGLIHIHPWKESATGENATLGLFAETLDIDDDIDDWSQRSCTDGQDNDVPSEFKVVKWDSLSSIDADEIFGDYRSVKLPGDGGVIVIALVAAGTEVPMPPSIAALREELSPPIDGPSSDADFCAEFDALAAEVPEGFIGSPGHVAQIERLLTLAPDGLRGDLVLYRDFLQSGAVDALNDPESTTTANWPQDVQGAVANIQSSAGDMC